MEGIPCKPHRVRADHSKPGVRGDRPRFRVDSISAPPQVLTERNLRLAIPPRDLTAEFFGDPKPGYSALERRSHGTRHG